LQLPAEHPTVLDSFHFVFWNSIHNFGVRRRLCLLARNWVSWCR
jgi:hypothetical protein